MCLEAIAVDTCQHNVQLYAKKASPHQILIMHRELKLDGAIGHFAEPL